jgi:hypothetical protein
MRYKLQCSVPIPGRAKASWITPWRRSATGRTWRKPSPRQETRRSHLSFLSYGLFRVTCRLCPVTSSSVSRCFKTGAPKSPALYILRLCPFHLHRVTCTLFYVIGPVFYIVWSMAYVLCPVCVYFIGCYHYLLFVLYRMCFVVCAVSWTLYHVTCILCYSVFCGVCSCGGVTCVL